jgi:ribose transport system substrate-binding protein
MKRILVALVALMLIIPASSFAQAQKTTLKKNLTIGFIPMTMNNEYFITMVKAAGQEAAKSGSKLIVQAGDSHSDADSQLTIIENMIQRKVDAICIVPSSSSSLMVALKQAEKAGIPVINLDTKIDAKLVADAGLKPVPFIGTNNYDGAVKGGAYALKNFGIAGKKVAILTGISGQQNAADRRNGFVDGAKGIKIIAEQTANWEIDQGFNVAQNILQANPDIAFISCGNDNMALGALRAVKEAGMSDKVRVMGFDAISSALDAIEQGTLAATVAQYPAEMGILGVQMAQKLASGQKGDLMTSTKTEIIDKSNVAAFKQYLKQFE